MNYYLAIDIGASSGRHILGWVENEKLHLKEIYRFKNQMLPQNGHMIWDTSYLFDSILEGLKEAGRLGCLPKSIGIDTWAVDYVLLDKQDHPIHPVYAYRDEKNQKSAKKLLETLPFETLWQTNGLQYQPFNTIFQLAGEEDFSNAKSFLMIPDYFNFLLTGVKANEYTNFSTTGLLEAKSCSRSKDLLDRTGIPDAIFSNMYMPGTLLAGIKPEIAQVIGYDTQVILAPSHDTASAFLASVGNGIILSSGTWSLLGVELEEANLSKEAMEANFTNEGGYEHRYRFLKNIMGLWIIQEVQRLLPSQPSFATLVDLARNDPFPSIFDVNDPRFLKPDNMIKEIQAYFTEKGLLAPQSAGQLASCVYHSLAECYKKAINELEAITGNAYECINIVGGGCKNILLNELIYEKTRKKVLAGPIEATAIGNLSAQMMADHLFEDVEHLRNAIGNSFEIETYQ